MINKNDCQFECLIMAVEILNELSCLSNTEVYNNIMTKVDISDEYLDEIIKTLSGLVGHK